LFYDKDFSIPIVKFYYPESYFWKVATHDPFRAWSIALSQPIPSFQRGIYRPEGYLWKAATHDPFHAWSIALSQPIPSFQRGIYRPEGRSLPEVTALQ
jgi:hypothetical protein